MNQEENHYNFLIWALRAHKQGDNRQIDCVAGMLPFAVRPIDLCFKPQITLKSSADVPGSLLPESLNRLSPPWPDLIITAGRGLRHVAEWIQDQSQKPIRHVHVGAPDGPLRTLDLLISPPQFCLPSRPNIIPTPAPLTALAPKIAEPITIGLPHPWLVVCLGGPTDQFHYRPADAAVFAEQLDTFAQRTGTSILLCDSRRTPEPYVTSIVKALKSPSFHAGWRQFNAHQFDSILALADAFVVTADSMSLMAECVATGKPTAIYTPSSQLVSGIVLGSLVHKALSALPFPPFQQIQDWLHNERILRYPRDLRRYRDQLLDLQVALDWNGARALGGSFFTHAPSAQYFQKLSDNRHHIVDAILKVLQGTRGASKSHTLASRDRSR